MSNHKRLSLVPFSVHLSVKMLQRNSKNEFLSHHQIFKMDPKRRAELTALLETNRKACDVLEVQMRRLNSECDKYLSEIIIFEENKEKEKFVKELLKDNFLVMTVEEWCECFKEDTIRTTRYYSNDGHNFTTCHGEKLRADDYYLNERFSRYIDQFSIWLRSKRNEPFNPPIIGLETEDNSGATVCRYIRYN